jgi:dihydroflavonol-4-reductase
LASSSRRSKGTCLEEASRYPKLRVVHTSSIAAVGASKQRRILDESSEWTIGGSGYHYIDAKRQGEEIALGYARQGMDLCVLNPGMILGPGDVYVTSSRVVLEYLVGNNRFYVEGGISYCDVREAAKAHVDALARGLRGERYIVAGHNYSYQEFIETMYRVTGLHRPLPLPSSAARLVGLLSEALAVLYPHSMEDVNRPYVEHMLTYMLMDSSKAARELGYVPRPFEETIRDTVQDLVARGIFTRPLPSAFRSSFS